MLSSVLAFLPFQSIRMRLLFGAACLSIVILAVAGEDNKKPAVPVRTHAAASIPQVVVTAKRMTEEQKKRYDEESSRREDAAATAATK